MVTHIEYGVTHRILRRPLACMALEVDRICRCGNWLEHYGLEN